MAVIQEPANGSVAPPLISASSGPNSMGGHAPGGGEDEFDNEPSTQPMSEDDKEVSSLDDSMESDAPEVIDLKLIPPREILI